VGCLFGLGDFNSHTLLMYGANVRFPNSVAAAKRVFREHPSFPKPVLNQVDKIRQDRPFLK
jgi:hypothetical protein